MGGHWGDRQTHGQRHGTGRTPGTGRAGRRVPAPGTGLVSGWTQGLGRWEPALGVTGRRSLAAGMSSVRSRPSKRRRGQNRGTVPGVTPRPPPALPTAELGAGRLGGSPWTPLWLLQGRDLLRKGPGEHLSPAAAGPGHPGDLDAPAGRHRLPGAAPWRGRLCRGLGSAGPAGAPWGARGAGGLQGLAQSSGGLAQCRGPA